MVEVGDQIVVNPCVAEFRALAGIVVLSSVIR